MLPGRLLCSCFPLHMHVGYIWMWENSFLVVSLVPRMLYHRGKPLGKRARQAWCEISIGTCVVVTVLQAKPPSGGEKGWSDPFLQHGDFRSPGGLSLFAWFGFSSGLVFAPIQARRTDSQSSKISIKRSFAVRRSVLIPASRGLRGLKCGVFIFFPDLEAQFQPAWGERRHQE